MNSRSIGKLTSVSPRSIVAEVYSDLGSYINTPDGIRFVGEVGSYVSIHDIERTIIGEIVGVEEKPQYNESELSKPNSSKFADISLIGEIVSGKFYFGVSKMPLVFSEVDLISLADQKIMLETDNDEEVVETDPPNTRAKLLKLGKSVIFPDYDVKVNIDKFFGFHFAVFGNTGAGKSNTIATIMQEIFRKKAYAAKGAKFVFIDSNGEYSQAFSKIKEVNNQLNVKEVAATDDVKPEDLSESSDHTATDDKAESKRFEIPVWALTADDWAILLQATEKTQIPVLRRAIDIAKIFYAQNKDGEKKGVEKDSIEGKDSEGKRNDKTDEEKAKDYILATAALGILNSSESSPSKSDKIRTIISQFGTKDINLNIKIDETHGYTLKDVLFADYGKFKRDDAVVILWKFFQGFKDTDFDKLIPKGKTIRYTMDEFSKAVEFATFYEGSISSQRIQEYTSTLISRLKAIEEGVQGKIFTKTKFETIDEYVKDLLGSNQIVNIDVSGLDDSSAEVISRVLAKLLLDYLKGQKKRAGMPINFVIEEAHRFIRDEMQHGPLGYNIFERIAKEGRKFGLLLGISSQRPSELSKTVVSQCSNFIIHRVQSPDDLHYISSMVPYVNRNMIDRLTYLQTGHALVFGTAINLPTLTKFSEASPRPDSANAKISEKWYVE